MPADASWKRICFGSPFQTSQGGSQKVDASPNVRNLPHDVVSSYVAPLGSLVSAVGGWLLLKECGLGPGVGHSCRVGVWLAGLSV